MGSATATPDKNGFQASAWHFAALVAGNIALALGPWLVRLSDTGPVSAGFWRLLLPLPVLALLAWRWTGLLTTTLSPTPRCSAIRAA